MEKNKVKVSDFIAVVTAEDFNTEMEKVSSKIRINDVGLLIVDDTETEAHADVVCNVDNGEKTYMVSVTVPAGSISYNWMLNPLNYVTKQSADSLVTDITEISEMPAPKNANSGDTISIMGLYFNYNSDNFDTTITDVQVKGFYDVFLTQIQIFAKSLDLPICEVKDLIHVLLFEEDGAFTYHFMDSYNSADIEVSVKMEENGLRLPNMKSVDYITDTTYHKLMLRTALWAEKCNSVEEYLNTMLIEAPNLLLVCQG